MSDMPPNPDAITIVYDGDCPFCAAFVRMTRLRQAAGEVRLVDARSADAAVQQVTEAGYDLNAGMAVLMGDTIYHGDAAMTVLAALTTPSGMFNKLVRVMFRSPARARLLYPPLTWGRALTLRLLGRKRLGV
ncbi:MAG: DCC1-like thiol-disulfide oxidoreductase family protein [Roseicyclus sp.]|jgi:predicted DCC family thiol-disulfide oxidoreductase YuxK